MKTPLFHASIAVCLVALICLTGCTDSAPDALPNPASKMSPAGRLNIERQGSDVDRFQEMNQVKVENKISPYRYVISTERYSRFGQLVKASSLSRTIHSSGVTLLCPTDDAFENWVPWLRLIKEGNQYEIDDFVGNHVIPMTLTYDDLKSKDTHATLAGTTLEISTRGGITANEARVRSGHVITENGSVIGLDDLAYVPRTLR